MLPPMREVRHPSLGFRIPDPIVRLCRWVGSDRKRGERAYNALGISGFASWMYDLAEKRAQSAKDDPEELGYGGHPFEVIPVLRQGGDALIFGLLVYDDLPGLVPPMVSYAPSEDGPCWLGDDAASGLANLLAVSVRDAGRTPEWAYADRSEVAEVRRDVRAHAKELARKLGVTIPRRVDRLTNGTRSDVPATTPVPRGYRFEKTRDNVGVLAPAGAFAPQQKGRRQPTPEGAKAQLKVASELLAQGFPASSLAVARDLYRAEGYGEQGIAAALAMKAAYLALGREFLARRVDVYVAYQTRKEQKRRRRRRRAR
jgi:hypothetical protein